MSHSIDKAFEVETIQLPINRCETCKHFQKGPAADWFRKGWGYCRRATTSDGCYDQESLALAKDSEDYSARLLVSPAFGCIQYDV